MATRVKPDADQVFLTAEEMEAARQARQAIVAAAENEQQSPEDRVKELLADLRADQNAKIRLYRRNGNNLSICQDYSLDDFESANFADVVRAKWGAGKYDVKLYGSKGVITSVTLMIQEPLMSNPMPQQNGGGNDALAQVLANMAQQQQMILEVLTRQNAPAPAVDPAQQMKSMLELMALMKNVTAAPPPPPPSPIGEIVAAMRELRGAAKELIPGEAEEKEPSMMQMAAQVVPMLREALQNNSQPPVQPLAIPQSFANAAPNPIQEPASQQMEIPQTQPDENEVNALQKMRLFALLNKLIGMAKENKPHDDGADLLLDDSVPDEVIEFLEAPDWWPTLAGVVPDVVPHETWFRAVREIVVASLVDEDPASPEAASAKP